MKKILVMAAFLLCATIMFSPAAHASDIFFAQVSAGSNNGTSCANAFAATDVTHGINISGNWVAGNTLHLCGTLTCANTSTTLINSQGAGSNGNPITVKFETGAILTCTAWDTAIFIGHAFVTVDGGTNGIIRNTSNGTSGFSGCISGSCSVQQGSTLVDTNDDSDITKNLHLGPVYVHQINSGDNGCNVFSCTGIEMDDGVGEQALNNFITDSDDGVGMSACTSCLVQGNTTTNCNHDYAFSTAVNANGAQMIRNTTVDGFNWDEPADLYHHDKFFGFANSGTLANCVIANNIITGNVGQNTTAYFFLDVQAPGVDTFQGCGIFNNRMFEPNNANAGAGQAFAELGSAAINGLTNALYANNTVYSTLVSGSGQGSQAYTIDDSTSTTGIFNNLTVNSPQGAAYGNNGTIVGSQIDNNIYPGGCSLLSGYWGVNGGISGFPAWQAFGFDAHGSNPNACNLSGAIASANLNTTTLAPQTGSVAIGAGKNLTSLCGTWPLLCFDANGAARPASGAWDVGAVNSSGSSGVPTSPPGTLPLAIVTTSPLPAATVGVTYSEQFTDTGGIVPIQWAVPTGSAAPQGFTLSSTGLLSGNPVTAGAPSFLVQATDSETPSVSVAKSFTLPIASAPVTPPTPTSPYVIQASPSQLQFSGAMGSTIPCQSVTVSDTTPAGPLPVKASTDSAWLTVAPAVTNTQFVATVCVKSSGAAGTSHGNVIITESAPNNAGQTVNNSPFSIPVTLTLSAAAPLPPTIDTFAVTVTIPAKGTQKCTITVSTGGAFTTSGCATAVKQ
jgi:hypothetical protein